MTTSAGDFALLLDDPKVHVIGRSVPAYVRTLCGNHREHSAVTRVKGHPEGQCGECLRVLVSP